MTIGENDVIRASAVLRRQATDDIVNVYHLTPVSIGSQTQQDLRDDIADYLDDVYVALNSRIANSINYSVIELFNVTDGTPEPSVGWPTLTTGGDAGDPMPDGVAGLSIGRTGVSKVIGKKFWPYFTKTSLSSGLWVAAVVTDMAAAAAIWIAPRTAPSGVTWDPGIYSRAVALFRTFTETDSTNLPAYQRRRKRGVGS